MRLIPLLILLLTICFPWPATATPPPVRKSLVWGPDLFFATEPRVEAVAGRYARIEFKSVVPAPAARVTCGVALPDENTGRPRWRKSYTGQVPDGGATVDHKVEIDLSGLEKPHYAKHLIDNGGGVIQWRVECWSPLQSLLYLREGYLAYRRDGKPKKGTYRLVPCITSGPFVDCLTDHSVTVSWQVDRSVGGKVELYRRGARIRVSPADSSRQLHQVRFTGLQPDTEYSYVVHPGGDGFPSLRIPFRTMPSADSQRTFNFMYLADGRGIPGSGQRNYEGVNAESVGRFLDMAAQEKARFILFGGDMVDGYTTPEHIQQQFAAFRRVSEPVGRSIPIYEAMGNHETAGEFFEITDPVDPGKIFYAFRDRQGSESIEAIFNRSFVNPGGSAAGFGPPRPEIRSDRPQESGPAYDGTVYSFRCGPVHMVVLNTNYWTTAPKDGSRGPYDKEAVRYVLDLFGGNLEGYLQENQLAWLDRDLAAAQKNPDIRYIFVMLHEPAFPNGGHMSDALFWGDHRQGEKGGWNDPSHPLTDVTDMRDRFLSVVNRHRKVVALLTADEHNYSRTRLDDRDSSSLTRPIWQLTSGGAGAPHYLQDQSAPWSARVKAFSSRLNACFFVVTPAGIGLRVVAEDGTLLDRVDDLVLNDSDNSGH